MDPAVLARLASGPGRALLDSLEGYAADSALALSTRLRAAGHEPELVTAVLAQARLRGLAVEKFGAAAGGMLFTADGLEQATRPELASRHASRFVAAGVDHVVDLGCGIGSDARAFAASGLSVEAVEVDPVTAARSRVESASAESAAYPSSESSNARPGPEARRASTAGSIPPSSRTTANGHGAGPRLTS